LADAEGIKQEAQSAFDTANKKFEIAKKLLDVQTKNNKSKHFRDYYQALRDAVKNNSQAHKCAEDLVPEDKKAIAIAKLNNSLALEEVEYRKELKKLTQALAEADNKNKLAINIFDSDVCIANAQEMFDISAAEVTWREDIK